MTIFSSHFFAVLILVDYWYFLRLAGNNTLNGVVWGICWLVLTKRFLRDLCNAYKPSLNLKPQPLVNIEDLVHSIYIRILGSKAQYFYNVKKGTRQLLPQKVCQKISVMKTQTKHKLKCQFSGNVEYVYFHYWDFWLARFFDELFDVFIDNLFLML